MKTQKNAKDVFGSTFSTKAAFFNQTQLFSNEKLTVVSTYFATLRMNQKLSTCHCKNYPLTAPS
jgi:hypothetical protein